MAKIFTVKINKDGEVKSKLHVPEGMCEEDVVTALYNELPIIIASTAMTVSTGLQLAARGAILDICETADTLLSKLLEEEEECDECAGCCEAADDCDH
jgi:hypothetical protein